MTPEIDDFLNELDLIASDDLTPGLEVYPKAARIIREISEQLQACRAALDEEKADRLAESQQQTATIEISLSTQLTEALAQIAQLRKELKTAEERIAVSEDQLAQVYELKDEAEAALATERAARQQLADDLELLLKEIARHCPCGA